MAHRLQRQWSVFIDLSFILMRLLCLLILLLPVSLANSAEYAVVISRSSTVSTMEIEKIRDVFLRKRNFDGEVKLVPVNLLGDESARREFEEIILQMNRDELNRYWISNHFQGISPPATQASLPSIKLFVQRVNGAIGYLPLNLVDSELKVLYEF